MRLQRLQLRGDYLYRAIEHLFLNRSCHALQIVQASAYAGVHAVKLQTYTADTITLDVLSEDFMINDFLKKKKTGNTYLDLPLEDRKRIADRAAEKANIEQYKVVKEYENNLVREKASSKCGT